jgi:uncharacterized protein (TIGR00297 family)
MAATRFKRQRKVAAGIAEARGGKRGAANVIANVLPSAAAALIAATSDSQIAAGIACVAALATSVGDTVATEVGQAMRGTPRLVTTGARVPAGTPGAVSVAGIAAGAMASAALTIAGATTGMMPASGAVVVVASAVVAAFGEGALALSLESRGWLDNDGVNLVAATSGAALAAIVWILVRGLS